MFECEAREFLIISHFHVSITSRGISLSSRSLTPQGKNQRSTHTARKKSTLEYKLDYDEISNTSLEHRYLGLPKVTHSGELAHPSDALDSVRYKIARAAKYDCPSTGEGKSMTLQVNYATDAWWQFVFRGGDCVVGCMTSTANNYDSNAVIDDGSCVYSGCTLFDSHAKATTQNKTTTQVPIPPLRTMTHPSMLTTGHALSKSPLMLRIF